jgi:hypothetical protein
MLSFAIVNRVLGVFERHKRLLSDSLAAELTDGTKGPPPDVSSLGTALHSQRHILCAVISAKPHKKTFMKKYERMGLMIGAALLQMVCFEDAGLARAQGLARAMRPNEMAPVGISPATAEVTRVAQSGVSDDVLIAFVKRSSSKFQLRRRLII